MTETVGVEFTPPSGAPLRIEWPAEELGAEREPGASPGWRIEGELDWDEVGTLRVLSAGLPGQRALALAALRPAGAAGHGEELVAALLVADGEAEEVSEALLSTEYGPDELPRRVGLELYTAEVAMPMRVAADVKAAARQSEGELTRLGAALEVRFDGERTAGVYDILTRA